MSKVIERSLHIRINRRALLAGALTAAGGGAATGTGLFEMAHLS